MVPSPRIAASATFALNSVEKLRRLAIFWNPYSQAGFHLIILSDFWGPLLSLDVKSEAGLKSACQEAEASHSNPEWRSELNGFLQSVRSADASERATEEFQLRLWEESPVAGVGSGTVKVDRAIKDTEFRKWLAEESVRELPHNPAERTAALNAFHRKILEHLDPFCDRVPQLKDFSVEKLRRLAIFWNPYSQAGFHLIILSDFWGPLLSLDVKSEAGLKSACQEAEASHSNPEWRSELNGFLQSVRSADASERATEEFQLRLWEESPVSLMARSTLTVPDPAPGASTS